MQVTKLQVLPCTSPVPLFHKREWKQWVKIERYPDYRTRLGNEREGRHIGSLDVIRLQTPPRTTRHYPRNTFGV